MEEIQHFEDEIRASRERLGLKDPLQLPLFIPKPGSNQIVKIEPFFYLPVTVSEQIKNAFVPFEMTKPKAALWLFSYLKRHPAKNKDSVQKLIRDFGEKVMDLIVRTQKTPKNQLIRLKEALSSVEERFKKIAEAFIKYLDKKYMTLSLEAPLYYAKAELIKKGGKGEGLPDFFSSPENPLHLQGYHYSLDLLLLNKSHPELWRLLKKVAASYTKPELPRFIFKTGPENAREILIEELARPLSLQKYLMPKKVVTLQEVKIEDEVNPTGLLCTFIENDEDKIWHHNIRYYMYCKKRLKQIAFSGKKTGKEKKYQARLHKYAKKLASLHLQESVGGNLLLDLIFGSYDSHASQYKVQKGQLLNIDFSRFGIPTHSYAVQERTYATLCTSLLDTPFVHEPLHASLQALILSWDITHFEQEALPSVGEITHFSEGAEQMRALKRDMIALLAATPERIPFKFYRHFKQTAGPLTITQQRKLISLKLRTESKSLKEVLFQKIHPVSFSLIINRLKTIQHAVQDNPDISLFALFTKLYPEFVPFMDLLEGLVSSTGVGLSFRPGRQSLQKMSLEEIMASASIRLNQKEQVPFLRAHIAQIRETSMTQADLSFMGEIYF